MFRVVHVNRIEFIRVEELTPMRIINDYLCTFTRECDFTEIDINELVGVNVEDTYENNQKVFSTTATFTTRSHQPMTQRKLAFRLTSVHGERYMLGTHERPLPIFAVKDTLPEKPSDASLKTVTIKWKSPYPLLIIRE